MPRANTRRPCRRTQGHLAGRGLNHVRTRPSLGGGTLFRGLSRFFRRRIGLVQILLFGLLLSDHICRMGIFYQRTG
ncbi:Hypothetical protein RAK1035_0872 [Roseovarius sp. AK1035]|nr:Hypothetical protein RAK1035_0872 [Roseovarius sp. AK1035]